MSLLPVASGLLLAPVHVSLGRVGCPILHDLLGWFGLGRPERRDRNGLVSGHNGRMCRRKDRQGPIQKRSEWFVSGRRVE